MPKATDRPECAGPECDRTLDPIQNTSGLCRSHYKQRHLGKPLTPLRVATKDLGRPAVCVVDGCGRPHKARGYCKTHNQWALSGKPLDGAVQLRLPPGPCAAEGCERERHANGYCTKHNANRLSRWRLYGITADEGAAIWESQDKACAICRTPKALDDLHVDHDHDCCPRGQRACGQCVRGLLCMSCNLGIGHMKDDSSRLRAAIDYLSR